MERQARRKLLQQINSIANSLLRLEQHAQGKRGAYWNLGIILALIFGVVSLLSLYIQLTPRILLTTEGPLNPKEPFSSPFILMNDSVLSIYDVGIWCKINSLSWTSPSIPGGTVQVKEGGSAAINDVAAEMGAGDKKSALCHLPQKLLLLSLKLIHKPAPPDIELTEGDISIIISFRRSFFWSKSLRAFHFIATRSSDGIIHWMPQP